MRLSGTKRILSAVASFTSVKVLLSVRWIGLGRQMHQILPRTEAKTDF